METITKAGTLTATVKAVETKAGGFGEFEAVISTAALDRDGEVLDAGWWEPLPAEIPIHIDHRMFDVRAVVARAVPVAEDGVLKVKGRYASTADAQMVRTLVAEGMVVTMSVGYHNAEYEDDDDGVPHLKSAELLEASFVSVPANTEALVTMAKSAPVELQANLDERVTKSLAGSLEEAQDHLRDALREANPAARWLWIRGTYPAEGRVVYEVETETAEGGYESTIYQANYTATDGAYTFDTPEEVDLAEVVVPAENSTADEIPAAGAAKAAPAASGHVVAMAKARADMAEAELLLLTT